MRMRAQGPWKRAKFDMHAAIGTAHLYTPPTSGPGGGCSRCLISGAMANPGFARAVVEKHCVHWRALCRVLPTQSLHVPVRERASHSGLGACGLGSDRLPLPWAWGLAYCRYCSIKPVGEMPAKPSSGRWPGSRYCTWPQFHQGRTGRFDNLLAAAAGLWASLQAHPAIQQKFNRLPNCWQIAAETSAARALPAKSPEDFTRQASRWPFAAV